MRRDVLNALSGRFPDRIPCKETLNHPGIIERVTGRDAFEQPVPAFCEAWQKLGIDIHAAPPESVRRPAVPGGTWVEDNTIYADIGVLPTSMPIEHCPEIAKINDDWVYEYNPEQDGFDRDHRVAELRGANRNFRNHCGPEAIHYHLYYTTLFMWPVVTLGWEGFMTAAALDPERFDRHFWEPWARISRKHVETLCQSEEDVIFVHDDLTMSTGPVFAPEYYDRYIFSRYPWILEPVLTSGKKLIYVIDGNCDVFLEKLLEFPIAGLMFESPATPLQRVLDTWGKAGRGFIGGIETAVLSMATEDEVANHTRSVIEKCREHPGFMISSCGGLHGDIPLNNIITYFRTRDSMGIPANLT